MSPDDDDADDALLSGPLLPPDDRLWRHPSELAALAPAPAADRPAGRAAGVWSVALVAGLVGAVLTVGVAAATGNLGSVTIDRPVERVSARPVASNLVSSSIPGDGTTAVVHRVAPALVHIDVTDGSTTRSGSAVAFRSDGYLLTVLSLVGAATSATATFGDGTQQAATVTGTDPVTGVAVLRVDRSSIDTAILDGRDGPDVGETAYALSAPASGAGAPTVTAGLVCAIDRKATPAGGSALHGLIQTDAPVSDAVGGVLAGSDGAVVGILLAADASSPAGFAVPIGVARRAADDIIATGSAQHAWLGVEADDLADATARAMHVSGGVVVRRVYDGSPAAAAGLQAGDTVTAVDGTPVASMSALLIKLRGHEPGEKVEIDYWRDGSPHTSTATLVQRS